MVERELAEADTGGAILPTEMTDGTIAPGVLATDAIGGVASHAATTTEDTVEPALGSWTGRGPVEEGMHSVVRGAGEAMAWSREPSNEATDITPCGAAEVDSRVDPELEASVGMGTSQRTQSAI